TEDVGQGEERRHQRVVLADVDRIERAVRHRDTQCLGLSAIELAAVAEEAAVDAGGRKALLAEQASAVRIDEGHDDDVAASDPLDAAAGLFDDADRLVTHALAFDVRAVVVGPEVAAADAGA